ncbi:MAG: hypothetical protein A2233_02040 [Candidatus Kerfeldbacteria bacterium RIFOXYA2_FULL_38_24]|uniref:Uncharacterized protein n=1 Tax=Candidatus Kerfeldbacteria bacterium RIFOXYB2_FULL_38_14 TaxID=1798547 RepID=A0A1G2BG82_9BACT|nr:MAG: hypothetical protein A2319_04640 [Candidatus Kerfeldbacteria bacterium RIFOXYB2_FULL_38_14]OGY87896.1 MAG: hypothetical protein A2233_02040 [Candidatus Kerfeldbacteria bacterium RIFOXYA2_FULL_38_24]OGY88689.1 MAG: hypothetical protein A2458_03565 [Candidatus Kerfeldbacteria bacterium RIFOXYC2_FULL_38_9]
MLTRKNTFYLFSSLDLITFIINFGLLARLVVGLPKDYDNTLFFLLAVLQILFLLSLLLTAYLHFKKQEKALILYYPQLVWRALFFTWSFGFIFLIESLFFATTLHYILIVIVIVAELARLTMNIKIQKEMKNNKLNI